MKKLLMTGLLLIASAGLAFGASQLATASATSTTTTPAYAIAIGHDVAKPVVVALVLTASDPLADVIIKDGNGTTTLTTAALAASATSVTVGSCTGLNAATEVVIANANGDTSEVLTVTSCTTGNLVFSAVTNAFRTGASVWEIDTLYTYSNIGEGTQQVLNSALVGYKGGPLVAQITAATGTATAVLTADYR